MAGVQIPEGFRAVSRPKFVGNATPHVPTGFRVVERQKPQATVTMAPNLSNVPFFGPALGAAGFNGLPQMQAPDAKRRYEAALEKVRVSQYPDMSPEDWAWYSKKALSPYGPMELNQHGALFGLTDEMGAGIGAFGSGARAAITGQGPGFNESYGVLSELEQARRDYGREQQGALGLVSEIAGGLASGGPVKPGVLANTGNNVLGGLSSAARMAVPGAVYGFGSTDGGWQERGVGAGIGAGLSMAAGAALPAGFRVVHNLGQRASAKQAMRQVINSAPTAAAIKPVAKGHFRAADQTGAIIDQPALQILRHDLRQVLSDEGLIMPVSGRISRDFPRAKTAMDMLDEFAQGPMTIKQAQVFMKRLRKVAASPDPSEGRIGTIMVSGLEDFMDSLPQSAFKAGNGIEASKQWAKGRSEWARFKRTNTIETVIDNARMHNGGFAAGLRAGFKTVLKSEKKRMGFSQADLAAMRKYVDGGSLDDFLKHIAGGGTLGPAVAGHAVGGPVGAAIGAGSKMAAAFGAKRAMNSRAASTAQAIRASVATPGGLPNVVPLPRPPGGPIIDGTARRLGASAVNPLLDRLPPLPMPRSFSGGR